MNIFEDLRKSIDGLRLAEFMEVREKIKKKLKKYPSSYGVIFSILDEVQKEHENPR